MIANKRDDFYVKLHHGVTIAEKFKKGQVIEPDHRVIRILWKGFVEPIQHGYTEERKRKIMEKNNNAGKFTMSNKCLPRHTMIINDENVEPLINL